MFGVLHGTPEARGEAYMFWNLERAMGGHVLVALMAGDAAHAVQQLEDAEVVQRTLSVLRGVFGPDRVPAPMSTHVTRWGTDRFARGSYSFVATGATGADYEALARPVGDSLFFAGEHTNGQHPATVPGAYSSGLRAAAEVQALVKQWGARRVSEADWVRRTNSDVDAALDALLAEREANRRRKGIRLSEQRKREQERLEAESRERRLKLASLTAMMLEGGGGTQQLDVGVAPAQHRMHSRPCGGR